MLSVICAVPSFLYSFMPTSFPRDPPIYPSLSPFTPYSSHPSIYPFSRLIKLFPLCTHSQFCQSFNHHSFSLRFFNDPQRKRPYPNISRRFVLLAVTLSTVSTVKLPTFSTCLIKYFKLRRIHTIWTGWDLTVLS